MKLEVDSMRKIILLTCLLIIIPYLLVTLFLKENEIKFDYSESLIVRVKREKTGNVDHVYLEDYITGVLAGELPITFSEEAFKAQSVAARSYVLKKMSYNKDKEYDVVDTVSDQVYLDTDYLKSAWKNKYVEKINKLKRVVLATSGEYLTYDGDIIDAFFFSTSVGYTENSEDVFSLKVPYLRSVKSEWDMDTSPVFKDDEVFTLYEFYLKLGLSYQEKIDLQIVETTSTGRIKKIKINGVLFDGTTVRNKLGLRSTYFNIVQNDEVITITTKGYGHGVGMSQYGAEAMSKLGFTYDEILKYYYQGVNLEKM